MHELNNKGGKTDNFHYDYDKYTGKKNKHKKIMSFSKKLSGKNLLKNNGTNKGVGICNSVLNQQTLSK